MRKTNWNVISGLLLVVLITGGGIMVYLHDWPYLRQGQGLYLNDAYSGVFMTSLVYAAPVRYLHGVALAHCLGASFLLPSVYLMRKRFMALQRRNDYVGNVIGKREYALAQKHYRQLINKRSWRIKLKDRNRIWCGVDLLTLEDVYMEGEDLFKGIVIIGAQGTGKTSRFFKTLVKQLAMDPDQKTVFAVFTLKHEDSQEFGGFLRSLGQKVLDWAMCNVVELCVKNGGLARETLQAYLQAAAQGTNLKSKDPFWINGAISRMVTYIIELAQRGQEPTLGNAYDTFVRKIQEMKSDGKMELGLLETIKPALETMTDLSSRAAVLHSPNIGGGLHYGPVFAAPKSTFWLLEDGERHVKTTGDEPVYFPHGLYELPPGVRLPFDWDRLLDGISLVLPPPGQSKPELFAINFIKASLLGWISADISSSDSKLLKRDPADRFRLVLAQDEGHNFLMLESPDGDTGFSDTRSLAENRQAGQISILATQSISRLFKSTKEKTDDFLSVNGNYFFMGVNGEERDRVLKVIGKVDVTKIDRSYGRQEEGASRTYGTKGQLRGQSVRANVNESIKEETKPFISTERYSRFQEGMAIFVSQGKPHRLVYCPIHAHQTIQVQTKHRPLQRLKQAFAQWHKHGGNHE